jgi:hypothetical protein
MHTAGCMAGQIGTVVQDSRCMHAWMPVTACCEAQTITDK